MNKNELILKSDIIKMIEDKIKYYQTRPKYYYGNKA